MKFVPTEYKIHVARLDSEFTYSVMKNTPYNYHKNYNLKSFQ